VCCRALKGREVLDAAANVHSHALLLLPWMPIVTYRTSRLSTAPWHSRGGRLRGCRTGLGLRWMHNFDLQTTLSATTLAAPCSGLTSGLLCAIERHAAGARVSA
jgi:hypothetical protein